jgi:hypothetical protein
MPSEQSPGRELEQNETGADVLRKLAKALNFETGVQIPLSLHRRIRLRAQAWKLLEH